MKRLATLAFAVAALFAMGPAHAQQAKDTVRIAQQEPVGTLDAYLDVRPEIFFLRDAVFDTLITYDYTKRIFVPLLATSWKHVDDTTLEFKLRHDVTWHDGKPFTAADVVYTVDYLIDPKVRLRTKSDYEWIAGATAVDPYTVRIKEKRPTPADLALLATQLQIYPEHVHGPLKDKVDFGHHPIGTGPYRAIQVDPAKGVILVKRKSYPQGSYAKPAGTIGRIQVVGIPDAGARVASLLAGNLDLVRDIPANQSASLEASGQFAVTLGDTFGVYYIMMDAAGRSGLKPLTDRRVREAILRSIKPSDLKRVIAGKWAGQVPDPKGLCDPSQIGCKLSVKPPSYDPAAAKKLMAAAGYPNGFTVNLTAFSYLSGKIAEVISGELRAININAKVQKMTFAAYRAQQVAGKQQILIGAWGGGAVPDVDHTLEFLFSPGARDYHHDKRFFDLVQSSEHELDQKKREQETGAVFDLATSLDYLVPLTRYPVLWVHSKDLKLSGFDTHPMAPWGLSYDMLSWAKK
jgi:peptide/nickel transport system substrate-binding protein